MKILHFSDIHIGEEWWPRKPIDFFSRRVVGAVNLALHRSSEFAAAPHKVTKLAAFAKAQGVDFALCTGDLTALGTEEELSQAKAWLRSFDQLTHGLAVIPGNHDIYQPGENAETKFCQRFEKELRSDHHSPSYWPRLRHVSDDLVLVSLNSVRPHYSPFDSSGSIDQAQLATFRSWIREPALRDKWMMVALHYAPRLPSGMPDSRRHGLANTNSVLEVCSEIRKGWLCHGHIHHTYRLQLSQPSATIFCAGSATHHRREGFWLYTLQENGECRARRGFWHQEKEYYLDEQDSLISPRS